MMNNVLLTGHRGFIGSNLKKKLESNGTNFICFNGDITSFEEIYNCIESSDFSAIFHLAAISSVPVCTAKPDEAFNVNVTGTFNLLEALKRTKRKTNFIFPSTSHVYGNPRGSDNLEIDEDFPLNPLSVYAFTKVISEEVIRRFFENNDLGKASVLRLFNHTHSTQEGPFFFPQLYKQILNSDPRNNTIKTGDLDLFRDFSSVKSLIETLIKFSEKTQNKNFEIYNVCSSQPRKLKDLANELASQLDKKVNFETDSSLVRKDDPKVLVGSNKKINQYLHLSNSKNTNAQFIKEFLEH